MKLYTKRNGKFKRLFSYKELAKIMNVKESTLRQRKKRGTLQYKAHDMTEGVLFEKIILKDIKTQSNEREK